MDAHQHANRHWQSLGWVALLLWPLAQLFRLVAASRRIAFRSGLLKSYRAPVPVLVVGNITVGGSGKTPLVIWLVNHLRSQGWRPAIVARGYGGNAKHWPQQVRADSDPLMVGDEAVLMAQQAACPVCVAPDRPEAVRQLLRHTECDIVVSDDGLQHYALQRDIEIAVIDGERRFGNALPLPAGPLREPLKRLQSVDLVITNGIPAAGECQMTLEEPSVYALHENALRVDAGGQSLQTFAGQRVHAIAGIGHPQRFFDMLRAHQLEVVEHAFADHYRFGPADLEFAERLPLLMTEKDAVKCRRFTLADAWVVRVEANPEQTFVDGLQRMLQGLGKAERET